VNAHHASECRQGSIPEPHRGQVSMRLDENEKRTEVNGAVWPPAAYIWRMCGRFTRNYTWQQIQTGIQPQHKKEPRLMRRRGSLFPFEDMKTD
jgi:hypothetical protein